MKVSGRSTSSNRMMYGVVIAAITILSSCYSLASDDWQDSTRSKSQIKPSEQSAHTSDRGHSQEKTVDNKTVETKKPTLDARDLLHMRNVVALEVAALCFAGDMAYNDFFGVEFYVAHSFLKAVLMLVATMWIEETLFYKYFGEKVNIYYPEDWNRCL